MPMLPPAPSLDCRHAMAPSSPTPVALFSLLLLMMAPSTGEGRARRAADASSTPDLSDLFMDSAATPRQNNVLSLVSGRRAGCYSCVYRGFLFPEKDCRLKIDCDPEMICYKITAFVEGAPPGSPPWVVHGCAQPSVIHVVREKEAECEVLRQVAEKLDPNGGPALETTFNRCAIHTCENYANDLPQQACNDGRLGPLWCWQYAIEHDEDIIKDSSKDFFSESDYFRATQQWLQNQRNATICSQQGLDTCLSLTGWFRGRRWSVQTCADAQAVVDMLDKEESYAYLQDTLSNDKMGKHIIRFSQNSARTTAETTSPTSSCVARTCDTNGCNAQVPFFHLRQPSSSSNPTLLPDPSTTSFAAITTDDGSAATPTTRSPDVTRLSSSLVRDPTATAPSSASSHQFPIGKSTLTTSPRLLSLVKNYSFLSACTSFSLYWLLFYAQFFSP